MNWPKPLRYLYSGWSLLWALLITGIIVPVAILAGQIGISQNRIHALAIFWARLLGVGMGCRFFISGLENIESGSSYIFACNHSSALDILALFAVLPKNFRWIAKKELFDIPIFGSSLKAAGYIAVDRSNKRAAIHTMIEALERIKTGMSVVIFPEGTRSKDGTLLPFKAGGFILTKRSGRPIVPVAIVGSHQALGAKSLLLNPGAIYIKIGQPLTFEEVKNLNCEQLAKITRKRILALF